MTQNDLNYMKHSILNHLSQQKGVLNRFHMSEREDQQVDFCSLQNCLDKYKKTEFSN